GATVVIQDRGLGMSPAGVAAANERLATPMAIDVAASERMGLVVVGHLAARHRITVELRGSPDGVTAQAWLPGQLPPPPPVPRTGLFPGRAATATLGDAAAPAAPGALPSVVRGQLGAQPATAQPATAPANGVPAVLELAAGTAGHRVQPAPALPLPP